MTAPGTNPWLDFIPTWVDTICTNIAPCCDASFDPSGCRSYYTALTSVLADGDPNHYAYDAAAAEACLAEVQSDLAMCENGFGSVCTRVARGLLRDGEPCENSRDCVSGSCATVGDQRLCGKGAVHAELGAPCAVSCWTDLYGATYCWGQPSQRAIGECHASDGLFCAKDGVALGPLDGSGARCEAQRASGAACQTSYECADGFCTSGSCSTDPGGDVGDTCPCKVGLYCQGDTCQAGAGLNEPCGGDIRCGEGLACSSGVCSCGGFYGSYLMPIVCTYG